MIVYKDPKFPSIPAKVHYSPGGVPYLTEPGVALVSKPQVNLLPTFAEFISGFDESLEFHDYLSDIATEELDDSSKLVKFAGQLCYMSLGKARTPWFEAKKYMDNIRSQGHGSVMEHANFSFMIYGASRSFTHELVRHRTGIGFSQVSQRYVDGKVLRFVERLEFQQDPYLHGRFLQNVDRWAEEYEALATYLAEKQQDRSILGLAAENKRDLRKKVNQVAREDLPNAAEAPILATANARTWRHIIEMRSSKHAEVQIRRTAMKLYECLKEVAPLLFSDYVVEELTDGTLALTTSTRKV